jgi:hypothetical protein
MSFESIQSCMSLKRDEKYVRGFGDFLDECLHGPIIVGWRGTESS